MTDENKWKTTVMYPNEEDFSGWTLYGRTYSRVGLDRFGGIHIQLIDEKAINKMCEVPTDD